MLYPTRNTQSSDWFVPLMMTRCLSIVGAPNFHENRPDSYHTAPNCANLKKSNIFRDNTSIFNHLSEQCETPKPGKI